jgi:hypothetical protein
MLIAMAIDEKKSLEISHHETAKITNMGRVHLGALDRDSATSAIVSAELSQTRPIYWLPDWL